MSFTLFCQGVSKPVLIIVNSLLAMMAIGYLILALLSYVGVLAGSHIIPTMLVNLVVGLGIFVLLTSILGFFAALRPQYPNLMYSYAVIILLALMFQAATAVVIFTTTKQVAQWSVVEWNGYDIYTRAAVQSEFNCCGFSGPYEAPAITTRCNPTAANFNASTVAGCYPRIANFVRSNFSIAYGILFFCLTLEALGLTNALAVICVDPNLVKFAPHGADRRDSRRQTHQTVGMLQPDDFDDGSHITSRSSPGGGGASVLESKSDYPYPGAIREVEDPRQSSRITFVPYGVRKTNEEIIAWGRGGARSPYRGDSNRLRSAFEDRSMVASVYSGGASEPQIPMVHHNSMRSGDRLRALSPLAELEKARAASIYGGSDRGVPAQQSPRVSERSRVRSPPDDGDRASERSYRSPLGSERGGSDRSGSQMRGNERRGSERSGSVRRGSERELVIPERRGSERSLVLPERRGSLPERRGSLRGAPSEIEMFEDDDEESVADSRMPAAPMYAHHNNSTVYSPSTRGDDDYSVYQQHDDTQTDIYQTDLLESYTALSNKGRDPRAMYKAYTPENYY